MGYMYDVFLTHDWGNDEYNRNNHERVVRLARMMTERGLKVWIDEDQMTGDIVAQMCSGVENSACVIVFVTKRYAEKVNSADADNCKKELSYAIRLRSHSKIVPVVCEERMLDTRKWIGRLGMELGEILYVPMWNDDQLDQSMDLLIEELIKREAELALRVKRKVAASAMARAHSVTAMAPAAPPQAMSPSSSSSNVSSNSNLSKPSGVALVSCGACAPHPTT